MSNRYVRGAPPSSNGGSNKWTASSSSYHSSRGGGRRGRGFGRGRSFGRGGRFPNHSAPKANNKWVRPASIDEQEGNDNGVAVTLEDKSEDLATLSADDGSENKELSESKNEERTPSSDAQKPEHNLERRGRNKLVPKKNTTDSDESKVEHISEPVPTEFKDEERITSSADVLKPEAKTEEKRTLDVHKPEQNLERKGRHKLVLKKDETEPSTEDNTKYSWKRKNIEATSSSKNNDERIDKSKQDGVQSGLSKKQKGLETVHGPRRILLSSAATEEGQDTAAGTNEQPQKTMTDYQYQDTSARGGRGRGRGKTKAMGLVRVKTKNPSETPICPTFSRGLPCNNAKCRLRHDVSTEASRPMCVFFQRNGMCSKGDDCPFKHVKISWDAEICPTFERLGYCEDEGCVLRHVASKRSKTKR